MVVSQIQRLVMVLLALKIAGIELITFDVSQTDWSTELSVPSGLSAGNYTVIISV